MKGVPLTREKEIEKKRDFTNQIKIGAEIFPVRVIKGGRKLVTMEWEKLRGVLQQLAPGSLPSFKNIRGSIIWDGREIFYGMKLSVILSLAPYLHTEEGVWEDWPAGKTFTVSQGGRELCGYLPRLLCLCPIKNMSKRLGFLTLYTDWKGSYWFKAEKSLLTARQETLASLERIADEPEDLLLPEDREAAARLYHLISEMLED